jgi:hypothetical protein
MTLPDDILPNSQELQPGARLPTAALSHVMWGASFDAMTATLEEIHHDPAILDRAISRREPLDILADGQVTATLLPKVALSVAEARRVMQARFAAPDWEFTAGARMTRDERNARG